MEKEESRMERLLKLCVAHGISLTSPREACCLFVVSTTFHAATSSNTVWDRFLPSDWQSLPTQPIGNHLSPTFLLPSATHSRVWAIQSFLELHATSSAPPSPQDLTIIVLALAPSTDRILPPPG
ncbi:hypothetical protein BHM03_00010665 [Ensete ventricosum]|nr:hypothetical protein BHM03_00010665 [Ensete ventricosum]